MVVSVDDDIILATTDLLPGYKVEKVLGLVSASSARARHLGRDIVATVRNVLGGEVKEYTELMAETREEVLRRLKQRAREKGANAVIGVRIATSMIAQGVAEVMAYGTAVVVRRIEEE